MINLSTAFIGLFSPFAILIILTYGLSLLAIWSIVLSDKERLFISNGAILDSNKSHLVPNNEEISTELEFIDLRGQEADEEFEYEGKFRTKKKPKKKESKNFSRVENLELPQIKDLLSSMGLDFSGIESDDRQLLVQFLDGIEMNNLRGLYYEGEHSQLQIFSNARINMFPSETNTRLLQIRSLYSSKDFDACIQKCENLLRIERRHLDAHRFIARSFHSLGEKEKSRERYELISQLSWDDVDSRYSLLKFHWNLRDYSSAEGYVNELLDISPDDIRFHVFSGRILARLGKHELAIARWNTLMNLDPDNIEALLGIGISKLALGATESALDSLNLASEFQPDDSRINKQIIRAYSRLGLLHLAIPLIERECENDPSSERVWQRRFTLELRLFGDSKVDELIDEVIRRNNHSFVGYILAINLANQFSRTDGIGKLISSAKLRNHDAHELYYSVAEKSLNSDYIGFSLKSLVESFGSIVKIPNSDPVLSEILEFLDMLELDIDSLLNPDGSVRETALRTEMILDIIVQLCENRNNSHWLWERRIAMLSSSLGMGGAERQVVSCLRGLVSAKGWAEVKLFCNQIDSSRGQAQTFEDDVNELSIEIIEFGGRDNVTSLLSAGSEEIDRLLDMLPMNISRSIRSLENEFVQYQPSIVHSWQDGMNIISGIAALIAGVPRIVMFARSQRPDQKTIMHMHGKRYIKNTYKSILGTGRAILAHNSKSGSKSYSDWLKIEPSTFEIIYNGVDFESVLKPDPGKIKSTIKELGIHPDAPVVGTVFRFVPEKRPKLWIEVAQKVIENHSEVHFIIVGGGQLFESFRIHIEELGLSNRIHLIGQSSDVASWLDRFDLFLLTSRVEGLPNVLIESLAMGVPVVSTDAGGASETFTHGKTGILCETAESSEIAGVVASILSNNEWMEEASNDAISQTRNKFGQETMISRLIEIYEKAVL